MCGIFGYVGARTDAPQLVLHGLKQLEYRGYDSWGIAVPRDGAIVVEKRTGKIGQAETVAAGEAPSGSATPAGRPTAASPTRTPTRTSTAPAAWRSSTTGSSRTTATCAASSRIAATPSSPRPTPRSWRTCWRRRSAQRGDGPEQLVQALMATFRRLDGLNAIAALDVRSGCLAAAKSGSPMTLGWASDGMLLASDYAALLEHTRRMTFLDENQAALLTPDGIAIFDVDTGERIIPDHHRGRVVRRAGRAPRVPGLHEQGDPRAAARPAPDRPRAHAPTRSASPT